MEKAWICLVANNLANSVAAASASGAEAAPAPAAAAPAAVTELNGLAIAWMLIKNFFGGLFGKKA